MHENPFIRKAHPWGDGEALGRLIRYTQGDVLHLKPLMAFTYETEESVQPMSEHGMSVAFHVEPNME